jgi:riboflavin synthase
VFTGLIQGLGEVESLASGGMTEVWIRARATDPYVLGESIALDGCCLTVVEVAGDRFRVQASPETLRRTSLGGWRAGTRVNLERSLKVGDRLGGHWVLGHVDGVARVAKRAEEGGSTVMTFELPAALAPFFVEKGSVAIDGVSLTLNGVSADAFHVALIPETLARTTLGGKRPGDEVNLEADVVGKYVARLLGPRTTASLLGAP